MRKTVWLEISTSAHAAFRTFIPKPTERIPITWQTWPYSVIHLIPLIFMAYLVRRPNTHLIRLLLLPTIISMTLRACFGYLWMDPHLNVYNWGEGLFALTCIGKALDFAFVKDGRKKVSESKVGEDETPAVAKTVHVADGSVNGSEVMSGAERPGGSFLPRWFEDAMEVLCSMRGLGWDFGKGVHVPQETRSMVSGLFVAQTLRLFISNFLIADALESCLKLVPGIGSPYGGSIFLPYLPPAYRYATSTAIHIATGTAFISGFSMVYHLVTLVSVCALGHAPSSWPPLFDNPWVAQSLHEFWAKRWHQLLRQTFLVFGGFPGHFVAGNIGLVLGTFLASGLFHECAMYAMGTGWDSSVVVFFLSQGVGIILERVWRATTGRRVGGWPGRVWLYFDIMVLGQPCVDSWHRRGLAGGLIIPPALSPARRILLPAISYLTGYKLTV